MTATPTAPTKREVFHTLGFWLLLGLLIAHFRADIQRSKERDSLAFVLDGIRSQGTFAISAGSGQYATIRNCVIETGPVPPLSVGQ